MNYKDAMKKCLEHTIQSAEFQPLTLIQLNDCKILVTKLGRVFKGMTQIIYQSFLEAILSHIQSYYIYIKAEGQIENEPRGGSLKAYQKDFLSLTFDLNTHAEQLMGLAFFQNICHISLSD